MTFVISLVSLHADIIIAFTTIINVFSNMEKLFNNFNAGIFLCNQPDLLTYSESKYTNLSSAIFNPYFCRFCA